MRWFASPRTDPGHPSLARVLAARSGGSGGASTAGGGGRNNAAAPTAPPPKTEGGAEDAAGGVARSAAAGRVDAGLTEPASSSSGGGDPVVLFLRREGGSYVYAGRVACASARLDTRPVAFDLELLDFSALRGAEGGRGAAFELLGATWDRADDPPANQGADE